MQVQDHAWLVVHHVLVVCIEQKGDQDAVHADRWFDDPWQVALVRFGVEICQVDLRVLLVDAQVVVGTVGHSLELAPAEWEVVLDVSGLLRVVREARFGVVVEPQALCLEAHNLDVPPHPFFSPVAEPFVVLLWLHEKLHLHKLELAHAEDEVAWGDLVAEGAALLRDAEGHAYARGVQHVLEVDEHALGSFGPQVDGRGGVFDGSHVGLEHQVEQPRCAQGAAALGAVVAGHVIGAPPLLAGAQTLAEGVDEVGEVPRGSPYLAGHDEGGVETDNVVAQVDHVAPPELSDGSLQRHARDWI